MHMGKGALYARVSTDGQQKEGTIDSQLAELRKQVAAAGHELVKEYIDDGYSGPLLDRPALNELRADLKSDLFDEMIDTYWPGGTSRSRAARSSSHLFAVSVVSRPLSGAIASRALMQRLSISGKRRPAVCCPPTLSMSGTAV
jgi:hypothetical protein